MTSHGLTKAWAAALGLFLVAAGAGAPTPVNAGAAPARLTVLYDAFGVPGPLQKDWGYAAFVEYAGRRILFDTGNNPDVLAHNARAAGVDLSRLDFAVVSHRHGDHMGGLVYLLKVNPRVKIYAPREAFGVFGGGLPSTFYRRDPSLPVEQRYFGGEPPEPIRTGSAWPAANFTLVDKDEEIARGIHLIALVSEKAGTLELHELSLAMETPEGMVIVVGCAHPGIDRIVEAATRIDPRIHLVAGGLHLVVASDAEISGVASTLRDRFKVELVAPGHCTGEPAFAALKRAFGDRYVFAGLGTTLPLASMRP